jgi:thiosulfate dehydrogenase
MNRKKKNSHVHNKAGILIAAGTLCRVTAQVSHQILLSLVLIGVLTSWSSVRADDSAGRSHTPPSDAEIPRDRYGDDVRLGQKIFTETYKYARRYTGNQLTCSNCHLDAGRKPNAVPLWAAFGMYPAYKAKNDRSNTLEERIQQCFQFSMNGIAPALDTPEVRALVTYMHFLAKGAPIGVELPGRGVPQIPRTGQDPNPMRGADVYRDKCVACHGANGEGKKKSGSGYAFPPLWGSDSYNKGADMARSALLAGFVKANMPLGSGGTLTDQEALDVAAYINLQLRPWDPRKGMLKGLFD